MLFEPIIEDNQYKLRNIAVINAPEADLIDFCVANDQIWSLWLNSDNVSKVLYCPIDRYENVLELSHKRSVILQKQLTVEKIYLRHEKSIAFYRNICSYSSWDWRSVALHSQFTHKININSILVDPREFYIQDIFMSGNFSLQTIAKSISVSHTTAQHICYLFNILFHIYSNFPLNLFSERIFTDFVPIPQIMSRISESSLIGCKTELLIEEATKVVETKVSL